MDRARDQLLAGPGLARHEHGRVGGGDTSHAVEHAAHGRRLADHAEHGAARGDHVGAAAPPLESSNTAVSAERPACGCCPIGWPLASTSLGTAICG